MKLRAIAIDDEPPALEILKIHCSKIPFIELKGCFFSFEEASAFAQSHTIDVVFLDIEMPGMKGTEGAKILNFLKKQVIFTTAHPQYAIDGFELQVVDYLLKPIPFERFFVACNKAYQNSIQKKGISADIFVKDGYDWVKVMLENVEYIQSDGNLLYIYHIDGSKITPRMKLSELMELLPSDAFIKTHKSYVVSKKTVKKIEKHQLTLLTTTIPVAASYKDEVLKTLLG